ncbi:hypothetical protein WG219_21240 [Ectopseudomonas mendocina]|uniref:Uncharacterized protein n=1 Tax=Ectopseudomonas mendocina TaxID=300 RepID=A0ABZ2RFH5_ECTME
MKIDFEVASAPPSAKTFGLPAFSVNPVKQNLAEFMPYALWSAVALSLGLNFYVLSDSAAEREIHVLQLHVQALEQANAIQQQSLMHHEKLLVSQHQSQLDDVFKRSEEPDSVGRISQLLQEQERDLQKLVAAMKESMRDLANMMPGPREWVNYYAEQLDAFERNSRERDRLIQDWAAGVH